MFQKRYAEINLPMIGRPRSYREMDEWLNGLSAQNWKAVLGAYASGGVNGVVNHLRNKYPYQIELWEDNDLRFYFHSRRWSGFRTKAERN